MILYLDTSALVKLYVQEPDSDSVREAVDRATHVATSRVAYPEARSALARRHAEGHLSRASLHRCVAALDKDWQHLLVIELVAAVAKEAGAVAERNVVRGFDAIHIASALECGRLLAVDPVFLTFDLRQRNAAVAEGLSEPTIP